MKRVKVNSNFKSLALVLFALVLSSNVWGEEIYRNEGATGTSGGVTASGNVNTTAGNGNPAPAFGNTSSSNATFTFTGFDVSSYSNLELTMDVKWGQFPSTTNTFPKIVVTFYKNNVVVKTDDATVKVTSKVTTYNTYTITDIPDFDKIQLVSNPSEGKTAKGAASTVYSAYIDNIVLTGESAPSCTTPPTVSAGAASDATTSSLAFNCSGGITSLGSAGCEITEYGYVYGTSKDPTTSNTKYKVGTTYATTGTAFAAYTATELNCGTTYYMRPYAINGNSTAYGAQVSLATLDCPVDHFIDNIQETSGYTGDGKAVSTSYTKVSITLYDKAAATSGNCEEIHYHFVGWVTAADRSEGNVDAGHIVNFQDNGNTPTGTTYYAVWAAEQE